MLKVTQKNLREFARRYDVEDITYINHDDAHELKKRESYLSQIGYATGAYGCAGMILQGRNTGKIYVIAGRTSAIYMF